MAMEEMRIELQRSLEEESAKGKEIFRTTEEREDEPRSRRRSSITEPPLALPQIQIPTFSGKLEEWDTYWGLFSSIVHEQDLPVLRKFAYLLIQWLKKKYAREEVAIEQLYRKVEEAYAKDATTAAQRKLLDDLSATMMQLTTKGQNVNHRWLLSTIFRKFDATVQEKALAKRAKLQSLEEWNWNKFQEHLEEITSKQEYIERSRQAINKEENPIRPKTNYKKEGPSNMPSKKECIYCHRTNHESYQCRTVPFEERLLFLTRNKLCHNCGKLNHLAKECKGPSCFKCGKKHHPSTCKGRQQQEETRRHMDNGSGHRRVLLTVVLDPRKQGRRRGHVMRTGLEPIQIGLWLMKLKQTKGSHEGKKRTTLLTGMAKILREEEDIDVRILLDTGSALSFIDTQLIKDLNLPVVGKSKLKIRILEPTTVEEIQYPVTQVLLEDKLGKIHELRLYGRKDNCQQSQNTDPK
ncbi:unnamed protein product [Heligmosomoides polygyrus]|uniref:CCHC-type domain-containing protein n=1 Tax=Heligmosomoides polygyrus TaxID=6339 RepID=A0A183GVQ5_HELPZ|nr:unnamed protein product [Heligmosomoides polygyrus]